MIKRFINDIKKYWKYIRYSTKSQLKSEITGSYLSWMWLIIEPICFMLIYTFISTIVFKSKQEYFPVFVFIGLTMWSFFQKTLVSSIKLVVNNRDTVTKVYISKFILLIVQMGVNTVKFFISFSLVVLFMIFYRVPISWNVLYFIPLFIALFVFTFGLSTIFLHFGVFIQDLSNITTIVLRLCFYMSGIFYNIETSLKSFYPYNKLLVKCVPLTAFITECRHILLYCMPLDVLLISFWICVAFILAYIGLKIVYKYENTYVKVMK